MNLRTIQLANKLCDQDRIIIEMFGDRPVKYIGRDNEFSKNLNTDINSKSVIAVFNQQGWLSDLLGFIELSIKNCEEFYIGINRYQILGNNTIYKFDTGSSESLLKCIEELLTKLGYVITKSGSMDNDQGKYFNFIQPLTWIYGTNKSN